MNKWVEVKGKKGLYRHKDGVEVKSSTITSAGQALKQTSSSLNTGYKSHSTSIVIGVKCKGSLKSIHHKEVS